MTDVAAQALPVTPFAGPSAWRRHRVTPKRDRPRCGAKCKRDGQPCRAPVFWDNERDAPRNGRCRLHGGASTGPRTAKGRARSLANLVQYRGRPQDINDRRGSLGRKPDAFDEMLELYEPGKAPRCQCGCLRRVERRANGNGWRSYATPACNSRAHRQREQAQIWANLEALHRAVVADAERFRGTP